MTTKVSTTPTVAELIWVGNGGWVACDRGVPDEDPRRVIAFVEHRDHHVDVLWVRERREAGCYETLREALQEITAACNADAARVHAAD